MNKAVIWILAGISVFVISTIMLFGAKAETSKDAKILKEWELPEILREVSDIEWIGENTLAAIQDEDGIVFIYDTETSGIIKKIEFAGNGDYEGMAVSNNTAFVVRSDGRIFVLENFKSPDISVKEYKTPLTEDQDVEGLELDKKNGRLLLSIKDEEPGNKNYKGIYAFDLESKKLQEEPVFKIRFDDPIFEENNGDKTINPSEIALHPISGNLYILDAKPQLVVFDQNGNSIKIHYLDKDNFRQAEGMTFSPSGELYISNEGKDGAGNVVLVELKEQ